MKIYTKKGDAGTTQLIGGSRVPKDHIRIDAYGTIDELNAVLGCLKDALVREQEVCEFLKYIQDRLFMVGSVLACDVEGTKMILPDVTEQDVAGLESEIDRMELELPVLKNFIIPGGHMAASWAHLARTVSRRAERCVVALDHVESVEVLILKFLNRLSDYFFVLARYLTLRAGGEEVLWQKKD